MENDPTESGMKLLINALKNEGGGVHFFFSGTFLMRESECQCIVHHFYLLHH